jgi:hypothetical protein
MPVTPRDAVMLAGTRSPDIVRALFTRITQ